MNDNTSPDHSNQPPTDHTADHATTSALLTLDEAAAALGITVNAVRQRIKRGTLTGIRTDEGWLVDMVATDQRPTGDRPTRTTTPPGQDVELVEHLREEVMYLRTELAKRSEELAEERRRSDVLQREALGRIEALTATVSDQQDGRQDATERPESVDHTTNRESVDDGPDNPIAGLLGRLRRLLRGAG